MLRLTLASLALLVCAANASLFDSLLGEEKQVLVLNNDENSKPQSDATNDNPNPETGLAIISDDTPIASMDDLVSEGQSGVVIRAKRYYGCGCGCCGCGCCATVAPAATMAPCGCGCCGCGYG